MKKFCITFCVLLIIIATVCYAAKQGVQADDGEVYATEYLRIHVRANSNSAEDQQVKYEVKDEVVAFITPYIAECVTKERALEVIGGLIPEIEEVCNGALKARGKAYTSRAQIRQENFPTRVYGELTLEEGVYDALIIELGEGVGDNWWCVIYPPLCFTSASADVEYRSLIYDIINKFFK